MAEGSTSRSPSPPVTFTKKKRGSAVRGRAAPTTSTQSATPTIGKDDDGEEDETITVVRTKGIGKNGKDGKTERAQPPKKGLSFGDEEEVSGDTSTFKLKKSKLSLASKAARASSNLPSSLDQASISNGLLSSEPASSYSAKALAALKAATPSASTARRAGSPSASNSAYMEVEDPMTEEDLTRNKFGDEYAHDEIPDAASIKAAKEKRAKAAASGAAAGGGLSEDFISLGGCSKKGSRATRDSESNYQGPHPESRLQREEDDLGSGEDEFDQYTGASERIGLGKKAEKERERRRKQNIREAMGDEEGGQEAEHGTNGTLKQDEMDEEEREWERSQMDRWSLPGERQRREGREKSPYTPAPIPHTAPLPTLTSTSARLSARLAQLNESAEAHSNVVHDAELSLKQMDEEETANKEQVQREGEKEAWFREFEEWAISVAGFLDEKLPPLEELESDFLQLLSQRTSLSQIARCKEAEDELSLFFGVPSIPLLPAKPRIAVNSGNVLTASPKPEEDEVAASPIEDGDALSIVRERRRALLSPATLAGSQNEYLLSAPDLSSFINEKASICARLVSLFSNVQASVFRDPAARVSPTSSSLNPSSIAARFSDWRSRYSQEYLGAWGGLALTGVWEFWARWEMLEWDALRAAAPKSAGSEAEIQKGAGPRGLDGFKWHRDLTLYTERHLSTSGITPSSDEDLQSVGGDDEAVATMISNVVVPKLCSIAEKGGYDPWSARDTKAILNLVEEVSYVLEVDGWRFQSLITAYLSTFRRHVASVLQILSSQPAASPPGFHPSSIPARISFLRRLVVLVRNLISWNRYAPESERAAYAEQLDQLIGRGMWNLIRESKSEGGSDVAKEVSTIRRASLLLIGDLIHTLSPFVPHPQILSIVPSNLLAADLKSRLESL